jgi:hypothetical protein
MTNNHTNLTEKSTHTAATIANAHLSGAREITVPGRKDFLLKWPYEEFQEFSGNCTGLISVF